MIRIIGLVVVFSLLALMDVPRLMERKQKKDLIVCVCFLGLGFVVAVLMSLDVPLFRFSPLRGIYYLIKKIVPY